MEARTTASEMYHNRTEFPGIALMPHVGAAPSKARYVVIAPHCSSRQDFGAHNNNLPNLLRALNERVFNVQSAGKLVPTPQPRRGCWKSMSGVATRLASRVREFGTVEPLTIDQFVEQCPSNKRALYAEAGKTYATRGWSKKIVELRPLLSLKSLILQRKMILPPGLFNLELPYLI